MCKRTKLQRAVATLWLVILLTTSACNTTNPSKKVLASSTSTLNNLSINPIGTTKALQSLTSSSTPSLIIQPSPTSRPLATRTSTLIFTVIPSSTPTQLITPSASPTYAILRGTVLDQANCRYGPGAAYLYKYGLYPGNNLEIVGRNESGTWIVIQAIGGSNPCWVKASLLDIHGDVMSLAPTSLPLPQSPYYVPLTGVSATRNGNNVVISWNPLILRAGDDSLQYPYLIEAWLCQAGQLSFTPIGAWETIVTVQDEPGCSELSHARVYGVEKHGYTAWVNIPWPQP